MSVIYTLDDIARTSDDAAVRARFDASTLTALRFLGAVLAMIAVPHFAGSLFGVRAALAGVASTLGIAMFFLARRRATNPVARFVHRRARATAITFLLIEASCLIIYNANAKREEAFVFVILMPMMAVLFRLLAAEHVLLHASLAAISALTMITMPVKHKSTAAVLVPTVIINSAALGVSLLISRRRRHSVISEWTERRVSAREQIRMRDELLYARELQLSMLPECAPDLPWADICSSSVPATEVGGDFYDYFVEDDCVALVCGDVAGHGMASGLVLSAVRGGLRVMRHTLKDPGAVLERLHDLVMHTTRRRMLVTISIVLIDRANKRAIVASAGHPPVLVRRGDGSVEALALYAPPLGVRLPLEIPRRTLDIAPGDLFVLHSDGIYETMNQEGESYGIERLQRVVAEQGGGAAEVLHDSILRDVAAFRGAVEQQDDVTVVICRAM